MCHACWLEFDSPTIDTPAVRAAASAVAALYEFGTGGNLHCIVDDWNLGDDSFENVPGYIAENIHESTPADIAAERRCLALLRGLTEEERASVLGLYEGFWVPDGCPGPVN